MTNTDNITFQKFADQSKATRKNRRPRPSSNDLLKNILMDCKTFCIRRPELDIEDFMDLINDPETREHIRFHLENPGLPLDARDD